MFRGLTPVPNGLARHFFGLAVLCLATIAFSGAPAWSQTSTAGTVSGQVTDEQNAAVPGTEVKIIDPATNTAQTTSSNDTGRYVFSQVNPGKYNLTFSKQGFSTYNVNAQVVEIGMSLTINAKLKIGSTSTTVEVTASQRCGTADHERHGWQHAQRRGPDAAAEPGSRRDLYGGAAAGHYAERATPREALRI